MYMQNKSPFRIFEPFFFSGLLDDPILAIRLKPISQFLLVDCGKIDHIAKRVLKSVSTVFITHAHMDHFMGFDTFARSVLVSSKTIDVFGPPSTATRLENKLRAYDWNLVEDYYCNFCVHEIHPQSKKIFLLKGSEGFNKSYQDSQSLTDKVIFDNKYLKVQAELCDHIIPVLAFKFTEKPGFAVDGKKIDQLGYVRGPWLKELKSHFYRSEGSKSETIELYRKDHQGNNKIEKQNPDILYQRIRRETTPASIGYMTDIGFTEENIRKIRDLMKEVTLLASECTYLGGEIEKARQTDHLCTADVNTLLQQIEPDYFLPMHLSSTYLRKHQALYDELREPVNCKILRLPERLPPAPILPNQCPELFPHDKRSSSSKKKLKYGLKGDGFL